MHARTMIALRIIFEDQLPISPHVILDPFSRAQDGQVPVRKFSRQRREPFLQWSRLIGEIHEDESFPDPKVDGVQRIIRLIKPGNLIHVRRTDQSTVKPVRPRVIWTLNYRGAATRLFFESSSAMATNIVKHAHFTVFV